MQRCLQLASLATGNTAPNPMVGAVLVHNGRIIGEGYHRRYGEAHAEVNCIDSVVAEDLPLISAATLYVSLEPCAHHGKTPPCADLILRHHIRKVVVGCRDPFVQVNGKGIDKLKSAGVEVITGVLEERCQQLNKRFFTFNILHRPYVVLKWAQTLDRKLAPDYSLAGEQKARLFITNQHTNRIVHKWRAEEAAILVGTNTALLDDPELSARLWPGSSPLRIVVDMHLRLPQSLKLFDGQIPTIVFNLHQQNTPLEKISLSELQKLGVAYYQVTEDVSLVHQMLNALYRMNVLSVMVEGGAQMLQSFIDEQAWDEAKIITNEKMEIRSGIPAPILKNSALRSQQSIGTDVIRSYDQTTESQS